MEYYSGPLVRYWIYITSIPLLPLRPHNLQPPGPSLPLHTLDESELPKGRRPKWLQDPNAQYYFDANQGGDQEEASIDYPEHWEGMPRLIVPDELEKKRYWIDYSNSEAYSIDFEKRRMGVSRFEDEGYVNELARSLQNVQDIGPMDSEHTNKNIDHDGVFERVDYSAGQPTGFKGHKENS